MTGLPRNALLLTRLTGATSSSVYLVTSGNGSDRRRFVARVLDNRDWLAEEPDLVEHEAGALEEAGRAGIAAPRLVAYSTDDVGFGAPVVLMTCVTGRVDLNPRHFDTWIQSLARTLAAVHHHPANDFPWTYESWLERDKLHVPGWTRNGPVWERAIELVLSPPPSAPSMFIHRDYHPTNVLWDQGEVTGVVDWINACRGPTEVDISHCRVNLALMFGPAAADQLLRHYMRIVGGFSYEIYWDVESVLSMCLPRPEYYRPWQHFGLGAIDEEQLKRRAEDFLVGVLGRD